MRMIDIAAAAGVSASTVSRVIRGRKSISPATVALVRRVMQEMGYRPGPAKTKRTERAQEGDIFLEKQVVVLSFTCNLDCTPCLNHLDRLSIALAKEGLQMVYLHWPWNHELPEELVACADGFVLLEGVIPAKVARQIAAKPTISLFCPSAGPGDQILTGYYQIGQLAASHLLQLNIRHMILLHPSRQPGFVIEEGEGFKLFCIKDGNITFEELTTQTPNGSSVSKEKNIEQQVQEMMEHILEMKFDRIGIFAPSCHVTALAYRYLYQRGIIPGDSIHFVCSSHQTLLLTGLYPKPAVIDIGLAEMTENAAHLLLLRIKNPQVNRSFQISIVPRLLDHKTI